MEDYSQAPRRNKASASTLSKKISKNANGSDLAPKTVYDDVFGGPPKFGVPTFSVQVEDYSEIFGRFHSLPGFSIPVLDLPVPHDCDVSIEVHASKFNYSEIFGGFNGVDFFDSYEELFGASKEGEELFGASKGESSSEEAWTPAGTRSPSEGSSADTLACSENNQSKSDGVTHNTLDGIKQLNVPNYEDMPRSEENGTNDKTNTVPGVALGVDGSTPPYKTEIINVSSGGMNDIGGNMDNEAIFEEILYKKTTSLPPMYGSITNTFGSDYELQRRSHGNGSYSGEILVSVSEISLKTQPSQVPPPMRPPPKLFTKQGESKIASENFGLEGAAGDGSPDFFDVEVDANSSAAASAAAMKEAMEKALARLKSAKELMERKRVSGKARKEDNKGNHETLRFRGNGTQGKSETEDIVMEGFGRLEGLKDIRTTQVAPNFEGSKKGLNGGKEFVEQKVTKGPSSSHSHIDKEAGEWRVEKQFYELAKTVKSKAPLEVFEEARNEKKLMAPIIIQKHEKSQKVAVKQVCQQLEENVEKSKASKEACVEENSRISEAAIEASELKTVEKKLTVAEDMTQAAKEASELKRVEKKLMVAEDTSQCEGSEEKLKMARETWELEEDQKKLERASEWEEDEERQREASCSGLSERRSKDAIEKEDNGKKPKDCSKREENEKKLKDSCQREENEKKLKEVYELEFNGRRLPEVHEMENNNRQNDAEEQEHTNKQLLEACEQEKNDKRQQEAHDHKENEKRLKQAFKEEENERRLKEVCELKENEIRLKEVYKAEENKKQVKVIFEPVEDAQKQRESNEEGTNENRENQACEWEENKVKVNQESLDLKVDKNFVTATGSFKPVVDNNFEGIQEDPIENSRKLKLAPEATEPEVSGGMTEAANDACECEGDEKELKIPKAGDEKDESGRSRPADLVQCAPEQDSVEGIKNSMEDLSLDGLEGKLGEFEIVDDLEPNKKDHRTSQVSKNQETAGNCQVANDRGAYQNSNEVAEGMKNCMDQGASLPSVMSVEAMGNMQKMDQEVDKSHCTEIKEKYYHKTCSNVEIGKNEKLESKEEKEHEREREKNMMAVERATHEARERAERAAVDRATAEARQRAMAEAREKLEKTSAEAREKSLAEKALTEARLRSERAAVERAIAEARERAAEKAVLDARERVEKSSESAERFAAEKFSVTNSRDSGMRQSSSFSDLRDPQLQNTSCDSSSRYANSSVHDAKFLGTEGESAQRCKARLERHRRIVERAAKALVEKNMRDLIAQREQAERNRLAETLDAEVRRWSSGKEGNLRALLSTLQYILGPDSGWQPIPLTEVITAVAVKKAYKKATLSVHPDKLQQRRASIQQKYICEKVFDLLKDAWNRFNSEER